MLLKHLGSKKGFTLVEVLVVAGIIAILAGILVPLIFKEIDESKISRASADVRAISTALIVFKKDVGQWPTKNGACADGVTLLNGNGNMPANIAPQGFDQTSTENYDEPLVSNSGGCYGANVWKGPYIAVVSPDPWGNAYFTNAKDFNTQGAPVWILSAGPNGTVDTPASSTAVVGDDIGLRIK